MSALTANLKAMGQWWVLWCLYGLFALVEVNIIPAVINDLSQNGYGLAGAWLVLSSMLFGISISAILMLVVGKTVTFMLPGHGSGIRQILFGFGVAVNALSSLVFLAYPGFAEAAYVGLVLSAFCMGMMGYWVGVSVVYVWGIKYVTMALLFGMFLLPVSQWIVQLIVSFPTITIGLGLVTTGGLWYLLGRPEFFRQYCRENWYRNAAVALMDKRQLSSWKTDRISPRQGWLEKITEKFFLGRMRSCESGSIGRYFWGQFYEMLGPVIRRFRPLLDIFQSLLYICIFGYLIIEDAEDTSVFFFLMITVVGLQYFNLGYSTLIVPAGRREIFVSTIMNSSVLAALLTTILIIAALLTIPLERILPSLDAGRDDLYVFHALPLRFCCVPLFMVPLYHSMNLCFRNIPFVGKFGGLLVCAIGPMLLFGEIRRMSNTAILTLTFLFICLSWLIFVIVCRYVFRKWSLVRI